jgi:hypothetical protein
MQTVACIKWGTAFPADYANRLYRGVMRHVVRPTQFVIFTDDATGLDPGIKVLPIPPINLPATGLREGPWRKLALWSRDLGVEGDVLFLDLDVVVTGPLDVFFDYEPGKLCLIRNWTQLNDGIGNSSVMRFPAGGAPHLVDDFEQRTDLSDEGVAASHRLLARRMVRELQKHAVAALPLQLVPRCAFAAGDAHRRFHRLAASARGAERQMAYKMVQKAL